MGNLKEFALRLICGVRLMGATLYDFVLNNTKDTYCLFLSSFLIVLIALVHQFYGFSYRYTDRLYKGLQLLYL